MGFIGVLLIIKPGLDGFQSASLLAVIGVAGLALRDLSTRVIPSGVSSMQLSSYAFVTLILTGVIILAFRGTITPPSPTNYLYLAGAIFFGVLGYYAIVAAMRIGEVSAVTPFRYTRLIFSLIIGILIFHEQPDLLTYIGAALIIGSGFYSILRERRLARQGV